MSDLVILDRDGVINEDSKAFVKTPEEWIPIAGSLEAIARLTQAGKRIIVVTNQSGIKRRLLSVEMLNLIHDKMQREVTAAGGTIDAIFFCPCLPRENCACYKPNPGMLHEIADRLGIELTGVPLIGDSLRDLEAAVAVGAQPHLVRTGNGRATEDNADLPAGTLTHDDLSSAVNFLLNPKPTP